MNDTTMELTAADVTAVLAALRDIPPSEGPAYLAGLGVFAAFSYADFSAADVAALAEELRRRGLALAEIATLRVASGELLLVKVARRRGLVGGEPPADERDESFMRGPVGLGDIVRFRPSNLEIAKPPKGEFEILSFNRELETVELSGDGGKLYYANVAVSDLQAERNGVPFALAWDGEGVLRYMEIPF